MQTLLKNELKRMFLEKEFMVTLLIGCGIAIWHFYQYVYKMQLFELDVPDNLYVCWIGAGAYHMQSYWYYMIFPLLAVLPYVGSYFDDLRTGYVKSVLLRCNRKAYLAWTLYGGRGIKAFPKTEFYLYYPIVNRTELETGHRDKANHVKGKKKTEIFNGVCF